MATDSTCSQMQKWRCSIAGLFSHAVFAGISPNGTVHDPNHDGIRVSPDLSRWCLTSLHFMCFFCQVSPRTQQTEPQPASPQSHYSWRPDLRMRFRVAGSRTHYQRTPPKLEFIWPKSLTCARANLSVLRSTITFVPAS